MGNVVWLVLLFTAAVVTALAFGSNDGLVSIFWGGWRADLSMNLFLIGLVLLCALVMMAAKAVLSLISLPRRSAQWRANRRQLAAQAALREALAEYFSARYGRALKAAGRALELAEETQEDREFNVLAHLLAAGSLHRLQDGLRRDAQLKRLFRMLRDKGGNRRADDGARLVAAEWALDDGQASRAVELLSELPPGTARRTQALRLRLRAARMERQPVEALHMARLLANHQAFSPEVARGLIRSLVAEALSHVHDEEQLTRLWRQFDAADRRDAQVVARTASRAAAIGAHAHAREWLEPMWERLGALEPDEREQIALAMIDASHGIGPEWLSRLESAARDFAQEPAVLAAVGTAFAERQLWGKAQRLLERAADAPSLPSAVRRRAWMRLSAMAGAQGDDERVRRCERAAVAIDI